MVIPRASHPQSKGECLSLPKIQSMPVAIDAIVNEAVASIRSKTDFRPYTGIILGSGLGTLFRQRDWIATIPYADIAHFPQPTVPGHEGTLLLGHIDSHPICALSGRFHYYEGHPMHIVTLPVRVMHALGIQRLIITNAAGGIHPQFQPGNIALIKDHINLFGDNPLRGIHTPSLPQFPSMLNTYPKPYRYAFFQLAKSSNLRVHEGVYVGVSGPSLETAAEIHFFQKIGGDMVGMSTVPEAIVAAQLELPVLGISVITNRCLPNLDDEEKTTHEMVLQVASNTAPQLYTLLRQWLQVDFSKYQLP